MNTVEDLIKKIEVERTSGSKEVYDATGLLRLQETMAAYNGEHRLVWSDELLKEIQSRPKVESHKLGIDKIDDITGGFKEQQLITLSGHTKHGKSAMGLFFMGRLERLNPVLIPLEQSNEELVQQLSDNGYPIPKFLSPYRIATRVTTDWIELRIVEGIAKYNTKFVVIDHLGYIDDLGDGKFQRENLAYRIGLIMQGLKNLAKKWNVTILLLVHISQADEAKPPTIQDIKNSSSIAQESDKVILIWRKSTAKGKVRVYENKTMFSVVLNRQTGKTGNVGLEFDTTTGQYKENHNWVDSMEQSAKMDINASNEFDAYGSDI